MERCAAVRLLRLALLLLPLATLVTVHAAERQVVLVVGADSAVEDLGPLDIQKLFLALPVLRDGHPLHPVRNVSEASLENIFLQYVVAMSQSAYDRRILTQALQQGRPRPLELNSRNAIVETLTADKYAVSYMWLKDVPPGRRLKVVRVLWTE